MIHIKIYNKLRTSYTLQEIPFSDVLEFTTDLNYKNIWWAL